MDDNAVDSLQFHQQTVATDSNSPLHLIREKEIEISGRMLAAKREADEIVSDARRRAAALVAEAHEEGSNLAEKKDAAVRDEVLRQIEGVKAQAEKDAEVLEATIAERRDKAVMYVVESAITG